MRTSTASGILTILLLAVSIFHALTLLRVIPYTAVWAGRLKSDAQMYVFETVSLLLNVLLLLTALQKARRIRGMLPRKALDPLLYGFAALFALNTLGNLFAANFWEKTLGAAITLLASYLCWRLARRRADIATLR